MLLDTSDDVEIDFTDSADCAAPNRRPRPLSAPLSDFVLMRGQVLHGKRLSDVRTLQHSLVRFGLLTPLTVVRSGHRLVVVDGRKRLAAIRRLSFQGRLPASLRRISYQLASGAQTPAGDAPTAAMLRNPSLFETVTRQFHAGWALDAIARELHISRVCVRDVLGLARLDEAVRRSLFERLIDVAQARAFATIPSRGRQRQVLMQLGPFAEPDDIRQAGHPVVVRSPLQAA